jgi:hypothetical protein
MVTSSYLSAQALLFISSQGAHCLGMDGCQEAGGDRVPRTCTLQVTGGDRVPQTCTAYNTLLYPHGCVLYIEM